MIIGKISEGRPVIPVTFRLPGAPDLQLECVIDTGFAGYVTLPLAAVVAMRFPFFYKLPTNLANDARVLTDVFTGFILWQDAETEVETLAMGRRPLIGRALLANNHIDMDFRENGLIRIESYQ